MRQFVTRHKRIITAVAVFATTYAALAPQFARA